MYHAFVRTRDPNLLAIFKKYRNALNKTLRVAKAEYNARMFLAIQNEPKNIWDSINRITNRKTTSHLPQVMTVNGRLLRGTDLAKVMNQHFIEAGTYPAEASLDNSEQVTVMKEISQSFFLRPTSAAEVHTSIRKLKNHTASGEDGISARPIKYVSCLISGALVYIINLTITTGIFSDELKMARVTAIYKIGKTEEFPSAVQY